MIGYIVVSILMAACVAVIVLSKQTKPTEPIRAVMLEPIDDVMLREEAIQNFKERRYNKTRGKSYREKRKTGACRARGKS